MKTPSGRPRHFDGVIFEFLSQTESATLVGTVLVRDREMVLDIPPADESPHYVIRGKSVLHYFAGANQQTEEDTPDVVARWAELGDIHVGVWIEEDEQWLISFRLPKKGRQR